jgi:hypothetical protein
MGRKNEIDEIEGTVRMTETKIDNQQNIPRDSGTYAAWARNCKGVCHRWSEK